MNFKIFTPPHTLFAANIICEQLVKLGHKASITDKINNDDFIYIIYNASAYKGQLSKKYIVYQTEVASSHWFNADYFATIRGALAVWDYSDKNVQKYARFNKNISIVKVGVSIQPKQVKDIPLTFYGWIKGSHRRSILIEKFQKRFKLNVVTNLTGEAMWNILSRSKIILNVHYYNNSPLEVFRINEALSHGCHVISEIPYSGEYRDYVHFYRTDSELNVLINKVSQMEFNYDLKPLDNLESVRLAINKIV